LAAAVHYVPSSLNPADPASRWWSFPTALDLVTRTRILSQLFTTDTLGPPWGLLHGLQRHL
jgi:hypothetical protein